MNNDARRRFAALTSALAVYAAGCGSSDIAPPQHSAFSDGPKHNVPRSQETPESYAVPARPTQTKTSRSRPRPPARNSTPAGNGCTLDDIKRMESGGNYSAVSSTGKYRGAYQFDRQTWASVGGTGDPAAASPEEQDARAAELMRQRGTQPWSVCR